jgi:hypothetical protein
MSELVANDLVLVSGENDRLEFSRVVGFLHRTPHASAHFVRLHFHSQFNSTNVITLTPKHLILVSEVGHDETGHFEYRPAASVQAGQFLKHFDATSQVNSLVRVVKSEKVGLSGSGLYAPLTESGTLLVDNVHVSCFSVVKSHRLAQLFFAAFNFVCQRVAGVVASDHYISLYARFLYKLVTTLHVESLFLAAGVAL